MAILLNRADFPEAIGIRPHSLKVTTSPSLTGEIAKEEETLSQLEVQGNYREVTAQDMGESTHEIRHNGNFSPEIRPKIF